MNKTVVKTPSLPMERIKVRVIAEVPVLDHLRPKVGKIYNAIRGVPRSKHGEFCIIRMRGKLIVLRRAKGEEPEYVEVLE